jgi:hypothetical protein
MKRFSLFPALVAVGACFDTMGVPQSSGQIQVREDGSNIFYWHFAHDSAKNKNKH